MAEHTFFGLLPPQATEIAKGVDDLFIFITAISVFFFLLVIGLMLSFARKYRAEKNPVPTDIHENLPLEILWTAIPTLILGVIFVWGFIVYKDMSAAPGSAYEIRAIGKQWLWKFQYDHGASTVGELYVPARQPVKIILTSDDVLHSLFIPDFRVKKDAVPGMYTSLWFRADEPGEHVIYCAEYCGTNHSGMLGKVIVMEPGKFEEWRSGKLDATATSNGENVPLDIQGKALTEKFGCVACHSTNGSVMVGPSFKGLYGKTETLSDNSKIVVDDAYIRESIIEPQAKVVLGFDPVMATYKGLVKEEDINAIIAYLQTLK